MGALTLLLVLATPWVIGCGALSALGVRFAHDRFAYAGWAWLAGSLITALFLCGWLLFGLPIDAFPSAARVLAAAAILLFARSWLRARHAPQRAPARPEGRGGRLERLLFLAVVAACLALTVDRAVRANAAEVVLLGDEARIWAGKAKAIHVSGGLNERFAKLMEPEEIVLHKDYPLLNPLLQVWTFAHFGRVTDVENRWVIQACVAALILAAAGALLRLARPLLAALFLVLLATSQQLRVSTGLVEADGLVALGLLAALDLLARFEEDGERRWWRLAALALAYLAWSKNEGMALALAAAVALFTLRLGRRPRGERALLFAGGALALLLPVGVIALHLSLNARFGFANDITASSAAGTFFARVVAQAGAHLGAVCAFAYEYGVRRAGETHLMFPLALALLLLFPRRLGRLLPLLTLACGLALPGFLLVYLGTPHDIEWHLYWSIQRILFQLLPVVLLWVAAATQELAAAAGFGASWRAPTARPGSRRTGSCFPRAGA
ncbi:MAG: hypothetical protein HY812_15935 [Planctomycetes bacterium]|nr:hypothetical protein [Planctomycetota bacterium]